MTTTMGTEPLLQGPRACRSGNRGRTACVHRVPLLLGATTGDL
jgi:hypothetical protein